MEMLHDVSYSPTLLVGVSTTDIVQFCMIPRSIHLLAQTPQPDDTPSNSPNILDSKDFNLFYLKNI
jgi:hypothetical protein